MKNYLKQFITCHEGTLNRIIHVIGFALIGLGIFQKSLIWVAVGALTQELGHVYQYLKTKNPKDSPMYCFKPQLIFAYPPFLLIVLYVILVNFKN
jgi:hypothetical protein